MPDSFNDVTGNSAVREAIANVRRSAIVIESEDSATLIFPRGADRHWLVRAAAIAFVIALGLLGIRSVWGELLPTVICAVWTACGLLGIGFEGYLLRKEPRGVDVLILDRQKLVMQEWSASLIKEAVVEWNSLAWIDLDPPEWKLFSGHWIVIAPENAGPFMIRWNNPSSTAEVVLQVIERWQPAQSKDGAP